MIDDTVAFFKRFPDGWVDFSGAFGDYEFRFFRNDEPLIRVGIKDRSQWAPGEATLNVGNYRRQVPAADVAAFASRLKLTWPPLTDPQEQCMRTLSACILIALILLAAGCIELPRSTSCAGLRSLRYKMTMDEVRAALGAPGSSIRINSTLDGETILADTTWDFGQVGRFVAFHTSFRDSKLVTAEVRRDLWTRKIVFVLDAKGRRESLDFDRLYCH